MLTLQKDKTSTELVELRRRNARSKKPHGIVYYSHNARKKGGNVAPAAGVLALHKASLKKLWKLSNADFDRICVMIDTESEPERGAPALRVLGAAQSLRAGAAHGDVPRGPGRTLL